MAVSDRITRIMIVDEGGNGAFGVQHIQNKIRTSSVPYQFDIAEGLVSGHSSFRKWGRNPDVGTAFETIADQGGMYVYLQAATSLALSSSSGKDIAGGAGARTVTIYGLDANYDEAQETVTLTGTTATNTVGAYLRVYRMRVITAGTSTFNSGTLYAKNLGGTTVFAQIQPQMNQTLMSIYTVPNGKTLYISHVTFSTNSDKGTECYIFVREPGEVFQVKYAMDLKAGNTVDSLCAPIVVPEKSDIEVRAKAGATTGSIANTFTGWLEAN